MNAKKNLAVLGATGSIGCSTLDIVRQFPERYRAVSLTAGRNVALLARQIAEFRPALAVVIDESDRDRLRQLLPDDVKTELLWGESGMIAAASLPDADMVVTGVVGAAGLMPTLAAIDAGKPIALANKETLVMAGETVMARAAAAGVPILPVDSEHSAIYQCIGQHPRREVARLFLTASGGPFRTLAPDRFGAIRLEDALNHPNWSMGAKITIDSATLMNKGLEFIEARHLFDMAPEKIEVIVHPQSIVHSMVGFVDGSVLAQLGIPDMKGPIGYALAYPERLPLELGFPDFTALAQLTFEPPDLERFPCLGLAFEACTQGGTLPAVLNAANEVAVSAFLERRIAFTDIHRVIRQTMERHTPQSQPSIEQICEADREARKMTSDEIRRCSA
ncbi:MAG: 1-deoxy-D-xylulose-5-phosphate reductoisomerase [Deltaproteobacteria bacterium]|nr:1-deoxy-D-xylulose-5-phosphate reductoisomerase [Deltaproteobacteria bacterium]MCB2170847.1 1-deoxy-D-xylulose-5-phosphate reductoisomerase [Deltaproteobacteria bacterium]